MFKRTKGYILLILLVVTGLASQVTNETLNHKERKFLIQQLKETKAALLASVKNLSEAQLTYKPAPDSWSIKEYVQHITSAEQELWYEAVRARKQSQPESKNHVCMSDADFLKNEADPCGEVQSLKALQPGRAKWKTVAEALQAFEKNRANLIKYARTTTEDVRSYEIQLLHCCINAYQLLLLIPAHTDQHTRQIETIKTLPGFPKS